jgi:phospholipid transport system substrate-binding protein
MFRSLKNYALLRPFFYIQHTQEKFQKQSLDLFLKGWHKKIISVRHGQNIGWSKDSLMKRLLYAVLILFITAQTGLTDDKNNAKKILAGKLDAAIAVLQKKNMGQQEKDRQIIEIVRPIFDFPFMAKLSLGRKYWPGLSKEHKEKFTDLFIKRLEASYLEKLSLYTDETVVYKTPVQNGRKVEIPTEVISKDKIISMTYKLYKSKRNWKIYDMEVEGISVIVTYRSQFDQILDKGTFDDLLLKLEPPENK